MYHQTLVIFFICEMNVSSYGFSFLIEFCFYTFLTKRKPWSLQYNTRNDRIFRCSAPREASCSCTRGQWRNQFITVSNQGHVNHMIFLKKYFHVGTFFRIQKCIHMHEQCNSFLQKVYFLKIVYTMSCDSYLQNTLFFSDNTFC